MTDTLLEDEISTGINPGNDFYAFVNEKWLASHAIPADKARIAAFTILADANTKRIKILLEQTARKTDISTISILKTFYRAAMDRVTIEKAGIMPLQATFDMIAKINTRDALKTFLAEWHGQGLGLVWNVSLDVDNKDSRRYVMVLDQSGLGLPDREYYTEEAERFSAVRQAYQTFLERIFHLLGSSNAERQARQVFDLEASLAEGSNTASENRDVKAKYNPYTIDQLRNEFPSLDWVAYTRRTGLTEQGELFVSQPKFLHNALRLMETTSLEAWRAYLTCHCLIPLMTTLPKAYDDLHFTFYGKVLGGAKRQEPRHHRVVAKCMSLLPEPTGQLFIQTYFDETAKAAIYSLVDHLLIALRKRIEKLTWMSSATKERAYRKLDTFMPLLGYPDAWRDYQDLKLDTLYVSNYLAIKKLDWQYDIARLHDPVNRKEWLMSPAMVNAYYWSNTNGIIFPAGILQPPFFSAKGDFAANYGGIGAVIGHEIIHGFDDQGSHFDEHGNMASWWTAEDRATFNGLAKQLEAQYSTYEIEGRHVNGTLTLGENIADLGGVLIAYDALEQKLHEEGNVDGFADFTAEQRFFISWARIWQGKTRPEFALRLLVTDPHSPNALRVNAVLANIDAFYKAFDVQPGMAWYKSPSERIRIW